MSVTGAGSAPRPFISSNASATTEVDKTVEAAKTDTTQAAQKESTPVKTDNFKETNAQFRDQSATTTLKTDEGPVTAEAKVKQAQAKSVESSGLSQLLGATRKDSPAPDRPKTSFKGGGGVGKPVDGGGGLGRSGFDIRSVELRAAAVPIQAAAAAAPASDIPDEVRQTAATLAKTPPNELYKQLSTALTPSNRGKPGEELNYDNSRKLIGDLRDLAAAGALGDKTSQVAYQKVIGTLGGIAQHVGEKGGVKVEDFKEFARVLAKPSGNPGAQRAAEDVSNQLEAVGANVRGNSPAALNARAANSVLESATVDKSVPAPGTAEAARTSAQNLTNDRGALLNELHRHPGRLAGTLRDLAGSTNEADKTAYQGLLKEVKTVTSFGAVQGSESRNVDFKNLLNSVKQVDGTGATKLQADVVGHLNDNLKAAAAAPANALQEVAQAAQKKIKEIDEKIKEKTQLGDKATIEKLVLDKKHIGEYLEKIATHGKGGTASVYARDYANEIRGVLDASKNPSGVLDELRKSDAKAVPQLIENVIQTQRDHYSGSVQNQGRDYVLGLASRIAEEAKTASPERKAELKKSLEALKTDVSEGLKGNKEHDKKDIDFGAWLGKAVVEGGLDVAGIDVGKYLDKVPGKDKIKEHGGKKWDGWRDDHIAKDWKPFEDKLNAIQVK